MNLALLTAFVVLASIPFTHAVVRLASEAWRPASTPFSAAHTHAKVAFARAVAPGLTALVFAVAVVLPAFVLFEPEGKNEWPRGLLVALASIGFAYAWVIIVRVARALRVSRSWTLSWMDTASPLSLADCDVPAFSIDAGFPVVVVAGLFRPQLLIDRRVLEQCTPAELAAIAAHERAHVLTHDNARRLLIAAFAGPHSSAAHQWRHAAEYAADERAANTPLAAADLASALVKIARMGYTPSLDATALSAINDGGLLEARVRRLLAAEVNVLQPRRHWALIVGIFSFAVTFVYAARPILGSIHSLTELLIRAAR